MSFNLPTSVNRKLNEIAKHGSKERLLRKVVELLVERIDPLPDKHDRYLLVGAIIAGDFDPLIERMERKYGKTNHSNGPGDS